MSKKEQKPSLKENSQHLKVTSIYAEDGRTFQELMAEILNQIFGR